LLILETTSENRILVAGSIIGIAFELFRTHGIILLVRGVKVEFIDDEIKRFIIRSHTVYTTTSQILDTIHACLLKNESKNYWQSVEVAAMRYMSLAILFPAIY
jgi:hypothetical protein